MSLIIAVATIGTQIGAITPALEAAIILTAIVTCLLSPIVFARLLPAAATADAGQAGPIFVVGAGADADALTERLRRLAGNIVAVTDLPGGGRDGEDSAFGTPPAAMVRRLREAGIDRAAAVIAMTDNDADTLHVCRIARSIHAVQNIVAWVHDPRLNRRFTDADARVVNPSNFKIVILESLVLSGQAIATAHAADASQNIRVIKLRNWWLREQTLRHMALPDGVNVLSIERAGDVIFPGLDTVVRANDVFTLTGEAADVDQVARRLARPW